MTSLVIGSIGLLFAVLPVLGIPISALGLLLGLAALVVNGRAGGVTLRWSLMGSAVCAGALAAGFAIHYAKRGYQPAPDVPKMWQMAPGRPYVPPPG
jgi:hypothetical protein